MIPQTHFPTTQHLRKKWGWCHELCTEITSTRRVLHPQPDPQTHTQNTNTCITIRFGTTKICNKHNVFLCFLTACSSAWNYHAKSIWKVRLWLGRCELSLSSKDTGTHMLCLHWQEWKPTAQINMIEKRVFGHSCLDSCCVPHTFGHSYFSKLCVRDRTPSTWPANTRKTQTHVSHWQHMTETQVWVPFTAHRT